MCGIQPQSIRLIRKRKTGKYRDVFDNNFFSQLA